MSVLSTIRTDLSILWHKITAGVPVLEDEFKKEICSLLDRAFAELETKLPALEQAAIALAEKAVPAAAPVLAIAAPVIETAVAAEVTKVQQVVDAEVPKL